MSKRDLQKLLKQMNEDQLRELVVEMYDATREFKRYLDYYVNPDPEKLILSYGKLIDKELSRVKSRRWCPRVTELRRLIKELEGYSLPADNIAHIRREVLYDLIRGAYNSWVSDTINNGISRMLGEFIDYVAEHELMAEYMPFLQQILDLEPKYSFNRHFTERFKPEIMEHLRRLNLQQMVQSKQTR